MTESDSMVVSVGVGWEEVERIGFWYTTRIFFITFFVVVVVALIQYGEYFTIYMMSGSNCRQEGQQ